MSIGNINIGRELLNVPMGDMIQQMAMAIAEGQFALDKSSMLVSELMSGQRLLRDLDTGELTNPIVNTYQKDGKTITEEIPRVLDSRVYFGYTYSEGGKDEKGKPILVRTPNKVSMMELGFTPTFYQFVDTIIEVKIAIKITGTTESVATSTAASAQQDQSYKSDAES